MITQKEPMSRYNKIILFVFLGIIFILLRIYKINQPLLEMHSVRQTQTAMITKNLLKDNFNFLNTRIDWTGNEPGYFVQELPFYQIIVASFWKIFGTHDLYGRLVSLLFSIFCAIYLFKIADRLFSTSVAYWAVFFFAICPLSIFMSRSFMINMTSLSLSLIGFYFWLVWSDTKTFKTFAVASISLILATLINLPVVFPAIISIGYVTFRKRDKALKFYLPLLFFGGLFIILNIAWNMHASQINTIFEPGWDARSAFYHFFGIGVSRFNLYYLFRILMYLIYFVLGFHGLLLLTNGLKITWSQKTEGSRILLAWFSGGILYYFVFFNAIRGHNYYALPIVPIACILIGNSIVHFIKKYLAQKKIMPKIIAILFIITIPLWIAFPLLHSLEQDRISYEAGLEVKNHSEPEDLVLVGILHTNVASEVYPTILYYAERKGWNIAKTTKPEINKTTVDNLRSLGAKFLIVTFGKFEYRPISSKFPLFKYFSHEVNIDTKQIIAKLKNQYETIVEKGNYILFDIQ